MRRDGRADRTSGNIAPHVPPDSPPSRHRRHGRIDTIGCGIAAFDEGPVRICRDVALGASGGAATVIGTNRRSTPDLATFANGAAFRYYDLNDAYVGRLAGHPSDHIAPPASRSPKASARTPRSSSPRSCSPTRSTAA